MNRVLVVADVSAEFVHGGAERMLFHHIRALQADGFAVAVLTRQVKPDDALQLDLTDLGVREYRLPFSGDKGYRGLLELRRAAKDWWVSHHMNYDLVVAEQPFVMWALLQAGCKLPRLQVCHSFAFEEYQTRHALKPSLKHSIAIVAMKRLEASVYESAHHLITLSQFMADRLSAFFAVQAHKISVVPGSADQREAISEAMRLQYRQTLAWETPVVCTLRNLVPRTGVDLMIQAAAIVKHSRPDVRFVVMGDGVLKQALLDLAIALHVDDVVSFTGFLSEAEVLQRLYAADVFMVPTRGLEGFGLVTLEANVCGTPVLATPIAANAELVPTISHNRLAASASPQSLATALLDMLASPLNEEARAAIHHDATTRYTWDKHDDAFVGLVRGLQ